MTTFSLDRDSVPDSDNRLPMRHMTGDDGDTPDIALQGCGACFSFPFEIDDYRKVIESEAIARYAMRWMGSVASYEDWTEKGEL